jgi:tetratricopeptide (TPR) repeat protein
VALLCVAGFVAAGDARAQQGDAASRAAVRSLAIEGDALYDKGDFAAALERYRKAGALIAAPTVRLREALCLEMLGKWVEAADLYRQVSRARLDASSPAGFRDAVEQAARQVTALEPRIPKLVIALGGDDLDGAKVQVDGREVPAAAFGSGWPVDPGRHEVTASKGARRVAVQVEAKEGTAQTVRLDLPTPPPPQPPQPPPPPPPAPAPAASTTSSTPALASTPPPSRAQGAGSAQRAAGWIGIGVGGAALAIGAITGAVAMSKKSSLESDGSCSDNLCSPEASGEVDAYRSMRTISTVGFAVGAVGVGAGIVLLLVAPSQGGEAARAGVRPWVGLGGAGVSGRF